MRFIQAQAGLPLGESRRWNFVEMQKLKKQQLSESVDLPHKQTEIFVMLPLDIIAVGEQSEGEIDKLVSRFITERMPAH